MKYFILLPCFSIIVYKSSQRSKKVRLQHFFTPDKSTVTSLVYKKHCLYVGLVSGSVVVYSRAQGLCSRADECVFTSSVILFCCQNSLFVTFVYPLKWLKLVQF